MTNSDGDNLVLAFFTRILLGTLLDFVGLTCALYIAGYTMKSEKTIWGNIKKATYVSLTVTLIMRGCQLVVPSQYALFIGIIFIASFGFAVNYFYGGGDWLGIFTIALLLSLMLLIVTNAVLAVIFQG